MKVTYEFAERIAGLADLLLLEDDPDATMRQLAELALDMIPGTSAAGVVAEADGSWSFAASAGTVVDLHKYQLQTGDGPVAEGLRYGEVRRVDNVIEEDRWPATCDVMAAEHLYSCVVLPLRTHRAQGGALAVYGKEPDAFVGSSHDIALLLAAQGGVALRNASLHRRCRRLVQNLQSALISRAVIEQAKGMLVAEYGYRPEMAFRRLSTVSQRRNRKVRDIAADLVAGRLSRDLFR